MSAYNIGTPRDKIAQEALTAMQSPDALAEIRRDVARECAEIADNEAHRWYKSQGELAARMIRDAIHVKFGVEGLR
jgi:hypothetical protein